MPGFMNSLDPVSGRYDKAQNPIVVLAELTAFQTGARVAPYWVGGSSGSLGPNGRMQAMLCAPLRSLDIGLAWWSGVGAGSWSREHV